MPAPGPAPRQHPAKPPGWCLARMRQRITPGNHTSPHTGIQASPRMSPRAKPGKAAGETPAHHLHPPLLRCHAGIFAGSRSASPTRSSCASQPASLESIQTSCHFSPRASIHTGASPSRQPKQAQRHSARLIRGHPRKHLCQLPSSSPGGSPGHSQGGHRTAAHRHTS